MGDKSKIEWTDATWNPVVGCSLASPGCTHCYAMKVAHRLARMSSAVGPKYRGLTQDSKAGPVWTGVVRLDEASLDQPLRWQRGRRIFVDSMGDLFHQDLPLPVIDKCFGVMALCPQHLFMVLTKRSDVMRRWSEQDRKRTAPAECVAELYVDHPELAEHWPFDAPRAIGVGTRGWPLPHVLIGVSVEDQRRADERRDDLRALAEAGWRTFVSYEPAIGPVDWRGWEFIKGLISGGENGPRPSHPAWHRAARDFCQANGITYFFKQWGNFLPRSQQTTQPLPTGEWGTVEPNGSYFPSTTPWNGHDDDGPDAGAIVWRIGKKAAGRLLDGREHAEFPA